MCWGSVPCVFQARTQVERAAFIQAMSFLSQREKDQESEPTVHLLWRQDSVWMVFGSSLLIVHWPNKSHRHYSTLGLGVHVPSRRSLQVTCWCAGSGILQQCRVQDKVNKNSQPHVLLMATVINVQQELKMCKTLFQESYANYLIDSFQ